MTMIDPNDEAINKELGKKRPQNNKVKIITLVIVGGGFILYVCKGMYTKKPAVEKSVVQQANTQVQTSEQIAALNRKLQDAMNKIKIMQTTANDVPPITATQSTKMSDELEKERKLRMNADTEISVSTFSQIQKVNASSANTTSGLVNSDGNSQFANNQAKQADIVQANKIANPDYTIVQGDFLHAVLTVAISSELPGMVEASLTRPVYSYTGNHLLLPAGSRLVGQFASGSSTPGSERLFIVWNRVITPKGISVMINSPSNDQIGRSGQGADYVDNHFWTIFGTGALLSIIGVGAIASSNSNAQYPSVQNQYQLSLTNSFSNTATKMMGNRLNIGPTLYINQGTEINVFVAHDLDFSGLNHNG